jgi:hypothetical protein
VSAAAVILSEAKNLNRRQAANAVILSEAKNLNRRTAGAVVSAAAV